MAKHMTLEDRQAIKRMLRTGFAVSQIAQKVGRPECTIAREIKKRRIDSAKGVRNVSSICAHFDSCTRRNVCPVPCGMRKLCKNCHACHESCTEFVRKTCPRILCSPFVCNGCDKERTCPLPKKFYIANGAQESYTEMLHTAREGIRATESQLKAINDTFTQCTRLGQSIHHQMVSNPGLFPFSQRTMYTYVNLHRFDATRGDLPFACMRKPRQKRPQTKTDAKCRIGRTYKDLISYWMANPHLRDHEVEMDGLEGQKADGKYIFTFILNDDDLVLAFLSDDKTSQACSAIVNTIWEAAGPELFMELFGIVVTDNGPEFSDPVFIERNPLFVARGEDIGRDWKDIADPDKFRARLFYCNSYSPKQKPHVERVHEEMRRVLVKGCSFTSLTQGDVSLVCSHVNSYTRGVLDDSCAYDSFVRRHGEVGRKFLDNLGIVRIDPNEVNLTPKLLGEKFERHVAHVILHRNGLV